MLLTAGTPHSQCTAGATEVHQSAQLFNSRTCGLCIFHFCIFYSIKIFLDKSINKICCWVFVHCIECIMFYGGFTFHTTIITMWMVQSDGEGRKGKRQIFQEPQGWNLFLLIMHILLFTFIQGLQDTKSVWHWEYNESKIHKDLSLSPGACSLKANINN